DIDYGCFDRLIMHMGSTRLQFRQMMAKEMLSGQLRAGIGLSSFVAEQEARALANLERQTRDFASFTIKADPTAVELSDSEVQAYYDEHASEFMSPEQVVLEYVELQKDSFFEQVEVSDEDLQPLYESEIANLTEQR